MNRTSLAHRVAPLNRRDVWRLLPVVLVALGAAACTPGESDPDAELGTRLTTRGAGDLLSRGFSPNEAISLSQPGSPSVAGLMRPAPVGPTPEQRTIDSLGVDFGTPEAPVQLIEFFDYGCGYCRAFHQNTRGPLHEQYVDPGRLYWKSLPFITGNWATSVPVSSPPSALETKELVTSRRLPTSSSRVRETGNQRPPPRSWRRDSPRRWGSTWRGIGPVSRTTSFFGGSRRRPPWPINSRSGGRPPFGSTALGRSSAPFPSRPSSSCSIAHSSCSYPSSLDREAVSRCSGPRGSAHCLDDTTRGHGLRKTTGPTTRSAVWTDPPLRSLALSAKRVASPPASGTRAWSGHTTTVAGGQSFTQSTGTATSMPASS